MKIEDSKNEEEKREKIVELNNFSSRISEKDYAILGKSDEERSKNQNKNIYKTSEFTLDDLKELQQTIEVEKKELERELSEISKKSIQPTKPKFSKLTTQKWARARQNLLALSRVKSLSKQIRLYGTSINLLKSDSEYVEELKNFLFQTQSSKLDHIAKQKDVWYMIHPDSTFNHFWSIITYFLMLYTCFITPYRCAFIDIPSQSWVILEYFIDCWFFMNMIITILSIYEQGNIRIASIKFNSIEYFKSWLFVDLISVIPLELFGLYSSTDNFNDLIRLFRLPRLFRLINVSKLFGLSKKLENNQCVQKLLEFFRFDPVTYTILSFGFGILVIIHVVACMWYFMAKINYFTPDCWVFK